MNLGERIKKARENAGLKQVEVSRITKINNKTLSNWEKNVSKPDADSISLLADLFKVSADYLLGRTSNNNRKIEIYGFKNSPNETRKIPIIGSVKYGSDGISIEYLDEFEVVSDDRAEGYVALRCKDDSLTGEGICNGDTIIVHLQETIENGQIAVVIVNGDEGTLKRVRTQKNMIILESANYAYPSRVFAEEEMNLIRIFGRVVEIRRTVK